LIGSSRRAREGRLRVGKRKIKDLEETAFFRRRTRTTRHPWGRGGRVLQGRSSDQAETRVPLELHPRKKKTQKIRKKLIETERGKKGRGRKKNRAVIPLKGPNAEGRHGA